MNDHKNKTQSPDAGNETDEEVTQTTPKGALDDSGETDETAAKLKAMEEKYLRTYADFENYRKRVAKEKEEARQSATELMLREFLEVKDHLELALSHSREVQGSADLKSLREGVDLTLKQLQNFLKKFGVEEVKSLGEAFNPALHEAIQQEASQEYAPGSVVRVYQKGYVMNGRLLRAARVAVASDKEKA